MAEALLFTGLTVLAVIGFADILRFIANRVLFNGKTQYILAIIPCKGHKEDIEYLVKSTCSRLRQQYPCRNCKIVLADGGIDDETREICNILCKELEFVDLLDQNQLSALLQENFHLQISLE